MPFDGRNQSKISQALDAVERRLDGGKGWTQGAYEDSAGRVCLSRALSSEIHGGHRLYTRVYRLIERAIAEEIGQPHGVVFFNDTYCGDLPHEDAYRIVERVLRRAREIGESDAV